MEKRFIGDNEPVDESYTHNRGSYVVGVDADNIIRFCGKIKDADYHYIYTDSSYNAEKELKTITYTLDNDCQIEYNNFEKDYKLIKGCPDDLCYCILGGWKLREICNALLEEKDVTPTTIEKLRRKNSDLVYKKTYLQKEYNVLNERNILVDKNQILETEIKELEEKIAKKKIK